MKTEASSPNRKAKLRRFCGAVTAASLLAALGMPAASAQIRSGTTGIDATGNPSSEMSACNTGRTQQDRDTCIREVRNANAEKDSGKLNNGGAAYKANAMKRCDALDGENKIACQARIAGYGSTEGSVASGGVIRRVETVLVPADASSVTVQPKTSAGSLVVIPTAK
jgi:hypothetical protein